MKKSTKIAILGAGPIGVETAVRAVEEGYRVAVYEAGDIGEHLRRWSHVRLFSPWELNRSDWGHKRLQKMGGELAPDDVYPSGKEYLCDYLEPLAEAIADEADFFLHTRVVGVSRKQALKGDLLGDTRRGDLPFLIGVDGPNGRRFDEADVVIDTTGVLSQPNPIGPGGLPAIGETELNGEIFRQIPDVDGDHHELFSGRTTLLVGHGHSAVTSLDQLQRLYQQDDSTKVIWAFRDEEQPRTEITDDPLPQRARLDRFANAASRGDIEGIEARPHSMVRKIEPGEDGLTITLTGNDSEETVSVDCVVANVGYRPDTSLYRELQVHLCYASDGPMGVAASLLAAEGSGDCLDQKSGGLEVLQNPEPKFFILGAKSYGRNSNFLLRIGFEQIDAIFGDETGF